MPLDTLYTTFGIVGIMQRGQTPLRCTYRNHTATILNTSKVSGGGGHPDILEKAKAPAKYSLVETVE